MSNKKLILIILSFYLFFCFSCAHQSSQKISHNCFPPPSPNQKIIPWWQKEENQWFFSALFILGVGIATSASILIMYNSGGLFVRVKK